MGALLSNFKRLLDGDSSRLDLVTSSLESGVKKLRLLPLSTVFNLFPRMVRDLAKTQAKEINFTIEGGDLLLDKRLLEEIKDPLMHLIRNAIDHGIEPPAERLRNRRQVWPKLDRAPPLRTLSTMNLPATRRSPRRLYPKPSGALFRSNSTPSRKE